MDHPHVPTSLISIMMKKGSRFTRLFSQEMRRLDTTGNLDLLRKRYSGHQTCKPPINEKPLGYEKLFFFIVLILGCIMSILVALFEYTTQTTKKKKQEITDKDMEISLIEEKFGKRLEGLSLQETENILSRLIQKYIKRDIEDEINS